MNKLNSGIACGLALITLGTSLAPVTNVFANDVKTTSSTQKNSSEDKLNQLAQEYKGVSLAEVNFDKSKMNERQLELYNKLLAVQYEQANEQGTTDGKTRIQYISNLDNQMQGISIQLRNGGHGLISTKDLGKVLEFGINAGLIVSGFGSIEAMVKSLGKDAAKKVIEENILPAAINSAKTLGLKGLSDFMGGKAAGLLVSVFLNPGEKLAELIDSMDKIPNNGWIELT